MMLFDFEKSIR